MNIHQNQVEGLLPHQRHCLGAIDGQYGFDPHFFQQLAANLLVHQIIFHQQNAAVGEAGGRVCRVSHKSRRWRDGVSWSFTRQPVGGRRFLQRQAQGKGTTLAGQAGDVKFAAHHEGQASADGQAEAAAAVDTRGAAVGLGERGEELLHGGGGNADARVAHGADHLPGYCRYF